MLLKPPFENLYLRWLGLRKVQGSLRLPTEVFEAFLAAPYDPSPDFVLPPKWKRREHDHPRYARFCYALAKATGARRILEVGSSTGGTTAGWARSLAEGATEATPPHLVCVDNDSYNEGVYPTLTGENIERVGLELRRVTFHNGDSGTLLPGIQDRYRHYFDIYLVDANHSYEGALADMENGLPMVAAGGLIVVHDVDRTRRMSEATAEHPAPVYDAFVEFARRHDAEWCILGFIRKHLGVARVPA
ncbi:MAG: class I SAM-dependent methyltransferase [Gemmatimonadales bacterium]